MIAKITAPRGERVEPLVYYLYGPGRHNEHTDPHIVAGWRHSAELEPGLRADGGRDFRTLLGLLNQPHAALGRRAYARPVWHCSVRAAPEDRMLSDDEWAQIAADVMDRTGLSRYGEDDDGVRWVAVRHADDHIHIVAMLARQDRARPSVHNDRYRVRDACLAAEQRYGLRPTAPADRTAPRSASRGEQEKAARRGRPEPTRVTLRRQVATAAASAGSEQEFFAALEAAGALVRIRYSTRNPGQVTGYAVALPGDTGPDGSPVWYGGGKLAADLTWPRLRQRWAGPGPVTVADRDALWEHAARTADRAAAHIRAAARTDPAAAADAAWAASDVLHVAADALGSDDLRQAADAFDRAARAQYGRIPARSPAGYQLRQAARLIAASAHLARNPAMPWTVLIIRLAALAEAVAELRAVQQRAAQAAAARTAARHLHAAGRPAPARRPGASTAARLAALSFPGPPAAGRPRPAPGRPAAGRGGPRPTSGPSPPRPRGPRR
jgi:MobA/VirD2-like, nuclease domain